MTPIVSPWAIYWINILNDLHTAFGIIAATSAVITFLAPIIEDTYDEFEAKRWIKRLSCISIVSALLTIFIPNKETMLTMLVVQNITPDNITVAQNNIADFVAKIVQAVNQAK